MAIALFLLVLLLGAVFAMRRVDIFTIAYFSSVIYFVPAIVPTYEVPFEAYLVYGAVLILLAIAALIFDRSRHGRRERSPPEPAKLRRYYRAGVLIVVPLIAISLAGQAAPITGKIASGGGGLLHYALAIFLGYVFVCAVVLRSWAGIVGCLLVYAWIILRGDRTQFVIAVIAAFLLLASIRQFTIYGLLVTKRGQRLGLLVLAVGVGIFGKDLYGAYFDANAGSDFSASLNSRLATKFEAPSTSFEPYHVQSILTYAIRGEDRIDSDYLYSIPLQFLPLAGELGGNVHRQSEIVKSLYFGDWSADAGVSSNFFAEGYLLWGMGGALAFGALYVALLWPLAVALSRDRWIWRVWACFAGAFWAFYLHRSSLLQMISHEKRVFYSILVLAIAGAVVTALVRSGRQRGIG